MLIHFAPATHGDPIVTGAFSGIVPFGSGEPNHTSLVSAGGHDVYLARYEPDGSLAWPRAAAAPAPAASAPSAPRRVSEAAQPTTLTGLNDFFLAKLAP